MRGTFAQAPFVRLLPPFAIGIAVSPNVLLPISWLAFALAIFFVLLLWYFSRCKRENPAKRFRFGVLFYGFAFSSGILLIQMEMHSRIRATHSDLPAGEFIVVQLDQEPIEKEKSIKVQAHVLPVPGQSENTSAPPGLLIYFEKDDAARNLQKGDKVVMKNRWKPIPGPANPHEFDFRKYAESKGIHYQGWLKSSEWKFLSRGTSFHVVDWFRGCRKALLKCMVEAGMQDQELAVITALSTGDDDLMDRQLKQNYSSTGVVHVLAVSGLHVGLIYLVLMLLLRPFRYRRRAVVIHGVFSILFLAFYAGITGFSPSVNRSAFMFSIMILAPLIHRRNQVMNSICSSAFVLLLMDPWQLFDVGFQLSYLAVGGIVLLQKKIYECLYLRNTWVDKAWQLTSVSVAAQLATFPLCLYYFHQFPNWFILSNLLIIPVSTVLLYSIIIFFAFHWIPGIGVMLANISSSLATIMNASVRALSELPGAVSRGIWISAGQTALLYGVLICLVVWWYTRTARYFVVGLFLMGLFATWTCGDWHRNLSTKEIVFHCVNNRTAITCTLGNESAFMYSGKWKEDSISFAFRLAPHWDRLRPNVHFVSLDSTHAPLPWLQRGDGFLNAAGKVVLLADTLVGATWMASSVVHGQVVLVTQNAVRHRDWNHFESCTIVFDNTCSPGYIAKAMGPLQEGRNSVFDLHAGAVTISLADDGVKQVSM